MKGKIGISMQAIEIRKPKTFQGKKSVHCKDCKHLIFNTGIPLIATKNGRSNRITHQYTCEINNQAMFYTSHVVCEHYKAKK